MNVLAVRIGIPILRGVKGPAEISGDADLISLEAVNLDLFGLMNADNDPSLSELSKYSQPLGVVDI